MTTGEVLELLRVERDHRRLIQSRTPARSHVSSPCTRRVRMGARRDSWFAGKRVGAFLSWFPWRHPWH